MEFQEAVQALHQGKIAPVYVLTGDEGYLFNRFKKELQNAVFSSDSSSLMLMDMQEVSLEEVVMEAETISFFAEPKLLWIQHPDFLTTSKAKRKEKEEGLMAYLQDPSQDVYLVFVLNGQKWDERKKIVKALKREATVVELKTMKANDVSAYIRDEVSERGYRLDYKALNLLLERTNYELTFSMEALERLILYVGETKEITYQDVDRVVTPTLDDNIFHLTDFIMKGQPQKAIGLYRLLIDQKQQPIALLALLESNFRLYVQVGHMGRKNQNQIAREMNTHPYRVKLATRIVQKYGLALLVKAYLALIELDDAIKSGKTEANYGIEMFILRFTEAVLEK